MTLAAMILIFLHLYSIEVFAAVTNLIPRPSMRSKYFVLLLVLVFPVMSFVLNWNVFIYTQIHAHI